jgi:hypothetical protein
MMRATKASKVSAGTYLYIADAAAAIVLIGLEIMVLRGYQKRKASAASGKRSES